MNGLSQTWLLAVAANLLPAPCLAAPSQKCGVEALGVARTIMVDGSEKLALGLQSYPRTLALEDHEVVLTFDDGPSPLTARVLDALAAQCVRATFFVVGRDAESAPALVRRAIAEGHSVGHHSYSHPERTLRLMSEAAAKADIDKGIAAVEQSGYGAASHTPHTPFFRFPGFADTPALVAWLSERKIAVFGSDLWASDWLEMTPQAELELVLSRLEAARKGIVLFHDTRPSTAAMLPDFLRALKERGYRVAHIVPGAGLTPIQPAKPDWKSTTEPIIEKILGARAPGAARAGKKGM